MILLLFIGYALVYALILMAVIAAMLAVCISFGVYLSTYVVAYVYARIRNRKNPEWTFDKSVKRPQIDLDDLHQIALFSGIMSMMAMVIGFIAYVLSDRSWEVTWTAVGVVAAIGVYSYFTADVEEPTDHGSGP